MVKRWALVKNGIVDNVCLWDGNTFTWQPPEDVLPLEAPDHVSIGWGWDGSDWTPPPPPPKPVPEQVTRFQFKAQLATMNKLAAADAAILNHVSWNNDDLIRLAWNDSTNFLRNGQLITLLESLLTLSKDEMDDIFIAASLISP